MRSRTQAIGALVIALAAGVAARETLWPGTASPAGAELAGLAGLEEGGQWRVVPLHEAREELGRRASLCQAPRIPLDSGEALLEGCPPRKRQLPLGVKRTLGLPIDLNALTAEDFEELEGVGPALAAKIVAERRRRGGFASVADLDGVPGVGPARLEALRSALESPADAGRQGEGATRSPRAQGRAE